MNKTIAIGLMMVLLSVSVFATPLDCITAFEDGKFKACAVGDEIVVASISGSIVDSQVNWFKAQAVPYDNDSWIYVTARDGELRIYRTTKPY